MKVYLRVVCAAISIFLVCAMADAQIMRPFLGEPNYSAPDKLTPRYGIRYNARGYDKAKAKKVTKTARWLERHDMESIVPEFQDYANQMALESQIPEWIDSAWDVIKEKWTSCGGTYADAARRFNLRSLYVKVEPVPFYVPEWKLYAAGMTDGHIIRAVNVWADVEKGTNWLRKFSDLMEWEIGNALMLSSSIKWDGTIKGEIGNKSPCGK